MTPSKKIIFVFFTDLPIGTNFKWKEILYQKTGEEAAIEKETKKNWVFEPHYRIPLTLQELKKLGLDENDIVEG